MSESKTPRERLQKFIQDTRGECGLSELAENYNTLLSMTGEFADELTAALSREKGLEKIIAEQHEKYTADLTAVNAESCDALQRAEKTEAELADEKAIVDRIWDMFGRPSYADLGGNSIYDLIAEVQDDSRQLARYREEEKVLPKEPQGIAAMRVTASTEYLARCYDKLRAHAAALQASNGELIAALEGIFAITDRNHAAWDAAHRAVNAAARKETP